MILAAGLSPAWQQIVVLERKIDALVYDLYGLTDAEIALVEGAAAKQGQAAD